MLAAMTFSVPMTPAHAGTQEPLDAAFLDYLIAFEGKDDNWTVVADGKLKKKAAKPAKEKPVAKPNESQPEVKS